MSYNPDTRYVRDPDFQLVKRGTRYAYVDYPNANWFTVNDTGHQLLQSFTSTKTTGEALQSLSELYGIGANVLIPHIVPFMDKAIHSGVLLREDETKQTYSREIQPFPSDIWIHVTERCNLECPFCYSQSHAHGSRELNSEDVLQFLAGIPPEHRHTVLISGGEPFLYGALPILTKGLKELAFERVVVITNGTIGHNVYPLVIPNIDELQVSVDGTTADIHERTRGAGTFERMRAGLRLAKELGIKKLYASFTPTTGNVDNLEQLPKFAYEHQVDAIHITRLMPVGRGSLSKDSLSPTSREYEEALSRLYIQYERINKGIMLKRETEQFFLNESEKTPLMQLTLSSDQKGKLVYRQKRIGCGMGEAEWSIHHDGRVYPCASLHHDEFSIGDIHQNSAEFIAEKGREFAELHSVECSNHSCKSCEMRYFCGGGCRACSLAEGSLHELDPYCEFYKESLLDYMFELKL